MTEFVSTVLGAFVKFHDQNVGDVEGNAYRRVRSAYADLEESGFRAALEGLRIDGFLARTRSKRDGAGIVVQQGALVPTPAGRNAIR